MGKDLPKHVFHNISTLVPTVNVDLLIKNEDNEILLAWRDDEYNNYGWHIPGGVIRYKETFHDRIQLVAQTELMIPYINYNLTPLTITETILPKQSIRGHGISILYQCFISKTTTLNHYYNNEEKLYPGCVQWFKKCPKNIIKVQKIYKKYF